MCTERKFRLLPSLCTCVVLGLSGGLAHAAALTVKVGVVGPLTGQDAGYGKDILNGVTMAVDEANGQHPRIGADDVRFEIVSQDDQSDPRTAVQVAQKLVDGGVAVVIGHFNSGTTLPSSTLYDRAGIPMITPSATNPSITARGYANVFRIIATDAQNAGNAGAYAVKVTKATRIAVLDDRTAFGQGEADEFVRAVNAAGGTIVDREYTNDKAVDFSAQLTHIKSLNADLLFFGGLDTQSALIVKRMKQLGMKAQFLAGGGVADVNFLKLAGPAAEGAMAWENGPSLQSLPGGNGFANQYKARFGGDPLPYSPFAYDSTRMAIAAMQAAKSAAPGDISRALKGLEFNGVTGAISFAQNGDRNHAVCTLYQVSDGAWKPVTSSAR
ncbi:amino acid/amide ABC transporter substrate-binding protein (HAAT family) [Paraburkholderia unamae]|uniref:branched-chain amino acid ABC transporter substrate-binding protein n=1 Tax=Paraburkholderia unamae TaxID=219649 RepID=UPI000DC5A726|nr:branched-chain amino acid ABC transporter substrate-binding protein [Paraburkholderia unamae]RAR48357.1 amino acid/amide ABC transporter substrate-binding protein (HAAT family) [Paraburkholderia unamae]